MIESFRENNMSRLPSSWNFSIAYIVDSLDHKGNAAEIVMLLRSRPDL